MVCCGNPLLDAYAKDALELGVEAKQTDSSGGSGTYPPDWNELSEEGAANQTETSSSQAGVGTTGEATVKPPAETSKPSKPSDASNVPDKIEGQVMSEIQTSASLPISGAPLMAIVAVIAILGLIGTGL